MSRTERRVLFAIAAAALALRAGAAVLTEFKPLFPSYYYTDAAFAHREAIERNGTHYSLPQRAHILFTASLYRVFGPRPLAPKLASALAASLGVFAFGLLATETFGARVGLASALMIALWPSHIFYTSQNFKEGLICGALMGAFLLLKKPGGLVLFGLLGVLRPPVLFAAAGAAALDASLPFLRRAGRRGLALLGVAACLALAAAASRWTPGRIDEQRVSRQYSERLYANGLGRDIGTLLFPDTRFASWFDVATFIPKASFHVLFMPLPGLYPMEGKPGRYLAAAENSVLLLLCVFAVAGAARGALRPGRLGPLLFFAVMTAGSSLLELDLGGAGRHKLMYLPMLFPFAAEELLRWRRS